MTTTRSRRVAPAEEAASRVPEVTGKAYSWRRRAVLGVLVTLALLTSGLVALHSPFLGMRHVSIAGGPHESRAAVLVAGDLLGHPPLIDVDGAKAVAGIDRLPWVAATTVGRAWPDGMRVEITERIPIGTSELSPGRFALLDRSGRVLGFVAVPPRGLVTLTGLGAVPPPGGTVAPVGRAVVEVAAGVPLRLESKIASFGTTTSGVVAHLLHGPTVLFGTPGDLEEKYVALATLETDEPAALASAKAVDLRVAEAPVLTP